MESLVNTFFLKKEPVLRKDMGDVFDKFFTEGKKVCENLCNLWLIKRRENDR